MCTPRGVSTTSCTACSPMTWTDLLTLAPNKPISVPRPHDAGSTPSTSACPQESMSALRFRLPRMRIALRERNWLQIQRIRLRATMWSQRERKRLLPIDISHCLMLSIPSRMWWPLMNERKCVRLSLTSYGCWYCVYAPVFMETWAVVPNSHEAKYFCTECDLD